MKAISTVLALLAMPISMYITHSILVAIHADRLLMFLFWVNIPAIMFFHLLSTLAEKAKK